MRRAIEKYKRCLFGRYKSSGQGLNLKEELKKFLTNREEVTSVCGLKLYEALSC
jgi:hypothetical protein